MQTTIKPIRRDGWNPARRADFLGALRVTGRAADACLWVGMSVAGAYALAKREPEFAAAWDAALAARETDRQPVPAKPSEKLSDGELMRKLSTLKAALDARPRGIVAQQKSRWA